MKARLLASMTLGLLFAASIAAQPPDVQTTYFSKTNTFAGGTELESVPNPQRVTIEFTAPGAAAPARLTMKEGVLARIDNEKSGQAFGVAVRIVDQTNGVVETRFFEITKLADDKEGLSVIETFNLQPGVAFEAPYSGKPSAAPRNPSRIGSLSANTNDHFTFGLVGINVKKTTTSKGCGSQESPSGVLSQSSGSKLVPTPLLRCTTCCISCDQWRYCGCAVDACGVSCCCNDCCT
jgi:hypothetical protein